MEKAERVSQKTGIPVDEIKEAFGISVTDEDIEKITTVKKAEEVYDDIPDGSEAEKKAMDKWEQLSSEEVEAATTIEEVEEVYYRAPEGSEVQEKAIIKIYELSE